MNFASTKQDIEKAFEEIKSSAFGGELPSLEAVNQFARLSQRFLQMAQGDWVGEAEDFTHLASQLLSACKKGDVEGSVMIVESLEEAKTYCHRMFKE
jgi:XXXCH domain-containing protein